MEQNIFITNRFGEKLETIIKNPEEKGPFPAIIFVTGFGATLHETGNSHDEIAERLVQNGFLTVQFSFAGRGKSDGKYEEMTLDRQAQQVEDILNWTHMNKVVDTTRIGIYALSFGVPTTLCTNYRKVKSLCLTSGAYFPYQSLSKRFSEKGEFNPAGISWRKTSTGEILKIKKEFWHSILSFDVMEIARNLETAVFIIHGDLDDKIPPENAHKVYKVIPSLEKKIKIFSGGDHGIINVPRSMRDEFLSDVVKWFRKTV